MDEIVELVCGEHKKTGRNIREILDCLRDEGYIQTTDAEQNNLQTQCEARANQ